MFHEVTGVVAQTEIQDKSKNGGRLLFLGTREHLQINE